MDFINEVSKSEQCSLLEAVWQSRETLIYMFMVESCHTMLRGLMGVSVGLLILLSTYLTFGVVFDYALFRFIFCISLYCSVFLEPLSYWHVHQQLNRINHPIGRALN